jgi:chromosome segregation ATPase
MASSIESSIRVRSRGRANIGWSEFLPRYLLIEDSLRGKRTLEIGSVDVRSLFRLHDAGASRVVGTSPASSNFEPSLIRGRRIEVMVMESGRVDFDDQAFDAILVTDLSLELSSNPRFLEEVRRVLAADGFCLIGFPSNGRSVVELVEDDRGGSALEPYRLEEAVRAIFPDARFYVQSPFIGVAIQPEALDTRDAGVSLEPSLAGSSPRPSHVIALCGSGAPLPEERTLVELPFNDFEAMTEAAQSRAAGDLRRVLVALKEAHSEIERRDQSLRAIGEKLPRIKKVLATRLLGRGSSPAPEVTKPEWISDLEAHDTFIDHSARPSDGELDELRSELAKRDDALLDRDRDSRLLREQAESYESEAADLRARVEELEAQLAGKASVTDSEQVAMRAEVLALRTRNRERETELEELTSKLAQADDAIDHLRRRTLERHDRDDALEESERRVLHLERTVGLQEQKLDELRRELESQLLVRHTLGSNYRDAEARIAYLQRRLEDQALERSETVRVLTERVKDLTDALGRADAERDTLRARVQGLEEGSTEVSDRSSRAERTVASMQFELAAERRRGEEATREADRARQEAIERAEEASWLRRALAERDSELERIREGRSSSEVDKKAVELTAAHLAQEVTGLRAKNQALAYERDTLATTSKMLLEERDAAAAIAKRTMEAEERASRLVEALEGAQAAIERMEQELSDSKRVRAELSDEVLVLRGRLNDAREAARRLEAENVESQRRVDRVDRERASALSRIVELDQRIAKLQADSGNNERLKSNAERSVRTLEEMLRETTQTIHAGQRETEMWMNRARELEARSSEWREETLQAQAARAEAEANGVQAMAQLLESEGLRALRESELAQAQAAVRSLEIAKLETVPLTGQLEAALELAVADRDRLEEALSRTLEEATVFSGYLRELELELEQKTRGVEERDREREAIERQLIAAEAGREVAEVARMELLAEANALRQQSATFLAEQGSILGALQEAEETSSALRAELDASLSEIDELERQARNAAPTGGDRLAFEEHREREKVLLSRVLELEDGLDRERSKRVLLEEECLRLEHQSAVDQAHELELVRDEVPSAQTSAALSDAANRIADLEGEVVGLRAGLDDERSTTQALRLRIAGLQLAEAGRSPRILERTFAPHPSKTERTPPPTDPGLEDAFIRDVRLLSAVERAEQAEAMVRRQSAKLRETEGDLERARISADFAQLAQTDALQGLQLENGELERALQDAHAGRALLESDLQGAQRTAVVAHGHLEEARGRAIEAERCLQETEAAARSAAEQERSAHEVRIQALEWRATEAEANAKKVSDGAAELASAYEVMRTRAETAEAAARDAEAHLGVSLKSTSQAERGRLAAEAERSSLASELTRAAERISALEEQVTERGNQNETVEQKNLELEKRVADSETALRLTETHLDEAKQHVQRLEGTAANDADRIQQLLRSVTESDLKAKKLDERAAEYARAEQRSADSDERSRALERKAASAEAKAATMERRAQDAEDATKSLSTRLHESESRARSLEQRTIEAEAKAQAVRSEAAQSPDVIAKEREVAAAATRRADERTAQAEIVRRALEARVSDLDASLKTTRSRASEMEALLRAADAKVSEKERALADSEARAARLEVEARALGARAIKAEADARQAEALARSLESKSQEAARTASALTPNEEVLRMASRASEAEERARKADVAVGQAQGAADQASLRAAQAEARAQKSDERTEKAEAAWRKTETRAKQAEDRATHAEAIARQSEQRGRDLEGRLRSLETLAQESSAQLAQSERRAREAEAVLRQLERSRAGGEPTDSSIRMLQLEAKAKEAEDRATRAEAGLREATQRLSEREAVQLPPSTDVLRRAARENEALRGEIDRLQRDLATITSKLSELRTQRAGSGANTPVPSTSAGAANALKMRCESLEAQISHRDGEVRRLKTACEQTAGELDEARADVGRKLAEIRNTHASLESARNELAAARQDVDVLKAKLARQGDAEILKSELSKRDQEIARIHADVATRSGEATRMRAMLQQSEQSQAQLDRKIAELESQLSDANHKVEILRRDLADKTERLRRLSELPES